MISKKEKAARELLKTIRVLERKIAVCEKEGLGVELALGSFGSHLAMLQADTESHLNDPIDPGEY